jgi:cyclomaltodextrinase
MLLFLLACGHADTKDSSTAPGDSGSTVPVPGPVALTGEGGDVWAFSRSVSGTAGTACDTVLVRSARADVVATRDGDRFTATALLDAGENDLVAVCRDADGNEGLSEPQRWTVRLEDRPTARTRVAYGDAGLILDAGGSTASEVRGASIVAWEWSGDPENPADVTLDGGGALESAGGDTITIANPGVEGDYFVHLTVTDADGVQDTATAAFRVWYGEALVTDTDDEAPQWVDQAVVYGVVPFFFGSGGFADVTARLDDLADLGVNTLWLSPVTNCPDDDFGYAVTDYFGLRDTFGPEEDFAALVDGAHARGMKVVLDFVPNHTSDEHPYYLAGDDSPYADFYDRDASGDVTHYFEWTNLPNLNYDNPEVRRFMTEAFLYWIRTYDIDGFRADVAWGVRDRAPDFWREWRTELERVKPDILLLAEATGRDPWYFDHGFDVAYDWTWELGEPAWQSAWEDPAHTARKLKSALTNMNEGFDPDALLWRYLENNDTGARFVTRYGADHVPVAATLLLTVPGVPALYTGEEVGAAYEPYDEAPPVVWDDVYGLTPTYQTLIRLHEDLAALHSREWVILDLEPSDTVLGYVRTSDEGNVLVLLNFAESEVTVEVPVTEDVASVVAEGTVSDLLGGTSIRVGTEDTVSITVPGLTGRVLASPRLAALRGGAR